MQVVAAYVMFNSIKSSKHASMMLLNTGAESAANIVMTRFYPDILGQFPNISQTAVKFHDISTSGDIVLHFTQKTVQSSVPLAL